MPHSPLQHRIAQLEARKKALQARLSKQERTDDTRRKILLGALVLDRLARSEDAEFVQRLNEWLRRQLPGFLTREADRMLFPDLIAHAGPHTPPSAT